MQLIYRGTRFNFQPTSPATAKAAATTNNQLIYRGQTYRYDRPVILAAAIKAVNWRFATICQLPISQTAIA